MSVPRRYLLVAGTFFLSVLLYVDRVCISAAKDPIAHDLKLSDQEMGWVLSVFALGYALCQMPAGWLADRIGPRRVLSAIVVFWSAFTGLTAAATNYVTLLVTRLLFGAGEAGAFPGIARASFSWIPMQERGLVQGINFSGGRLGAAFALPVVAAMIQFLGWRMSFVVLMIVGFAWAAFWYWWFRDDPTQQTGIDPDELHYILAERQQRAEPGGAPSTLTPFTLVSSGNLWLVSLQYFSSNFTFFFCLTWLFPHLKEEFKLGDVEAGFYSAAPFVAGALGNWFAGWLVDRIYSKGQWIASRRAPAILGFALAAVGVLGMINATSALSSIVWLSLAIFGADMTLAPSWSACIDIGREHSGVVSGTMNMAGNLGSFVTGLAFPYLAEWTGSDDAYFYTAAALNVAAVVLWCLIDPRHPLESRA